MSKVSILINTMHKVTLFLFRFPCLIKVFAVVVFVANRSALCGPVNVLFESNGQSLKLGEIKFDDSQVQHKNMFCHLSIRMGVCIV